MHQPGADAHREQMLPWESCHSIQGLEPESMEEPRRFRWSLLQDQLWAAEQMDYLHHGDNDLEKPFMTEEECDVHRRTGVVAFVPLNAGWGAELL